MTSDASSYFSSLFFFYFFIKRTLFGHSALYVHNDSAVTCVKCKKMSREKGAEPRHAPVIIVLRNRSATHLADQRKLHAGRESRPGVRRSARDSARRYTFCTGRRPIEGWPMRHRDGVTTRKSRRWDRALTFSLPANRFGHRSSWKRATKGKTHAHYRPSNVHLAPLCLMNGRLRREPIFTLNFF